MKLDIAERLLNEASIGGLVKLASAAAIFFGAEDVREFLGSIADRLTDLGGIVQTIIESIAVELTAGATALAGVRDLVRKTIAQVTGGNNEKPA